MITVREASVRIGCSPQQVRTLIRSGKLRAKKSPLPLGGGYYYLIDERDVTKYSKTQLRGWPRGRSRKES